MKRSSCDIKHRSRPSTARRQQGVGMIEILVTLLVVAVGLLGVAALQNVSLSTNNSAMARSMATISSYSIMDAMRIDSTNALAGDYDGTVAANGCAAMATGTLAEKQLQVWCNQLAQNLGAVATTTGKIDCNAATEACTVTVTFDDSRSGGSNTLQTVTKSEL